MLPHSLEAEKAALGSILIDNDVVGLAFPVLRPTDFYDNKNRLVYQVMLDLEITGEPVDYVTVASRLQDKGEYTSIGGSAYISELMQSTPSSIHIEYYIDTIKNYAKLRNLVITAQQVINSALNTKADSVNDVLDKSADLLYNVFEEAESQGSTTAEVMMRDYWDDLERRYNNPVVAEISTGFPELDTVTNGYVPGDLIVVAGRPSWGKTSWIMSSMLKLGEADVPCALFPYEMSHLQTSQRWVSMDSGVPLLKVKSAVGLDEVELDKMLKAMTKIAKFPIYADSNAFGDIYYLTSAIRLYVARYDVKVIFIDYLQIIPTHTDDLVNEYGKITRTLKILARALNITIVLVSQLNRAVEHREGNKPLMADLRQSGRIEEDADIILFILRDKEDGRVLIGKNRNGPAGGALDTFFEEETTKFIGREV